MDSIGSIVVIAVVGAVGAPVVLIEAAAAVAVLTAVQQCVGVGKRRLKSIDSIASTLDEPN